MVARTVLRMNPKEAMLHVSMSLRMNARLIRASVALRPMLPNMPAKSNAFR